MAGSVIPTVVARQVVRHERILERGLVIRGMPSDPPRVVVAPWNSLVLVRNLAVATSTTVTITKEDVLDYLRVQLGLPASVPNTFARFRCMKVRVWLDAGSIAVPIALLMRPFAIIGEDDAEKVEDWTGDVQYAKCGYVWPRSQQEAVFAIGGTANDIILRLSHSSTQTKQVIMYLEILWASQITAVDLFRSMDAPEVDGSLESLEKLALS